jgi:AcrR family transcriptional regulator
MPKVTDEHRAACRTEILAAACRCFACDGFHATSDADIIAESGLSAGAVYLYFRTKTEIISAVVEMTLSTADELFAELLADDATPTPEQTVAFMVDAVMQRAVHHPTLDVDMSRIALRAWAEARPSDRRTHRAHPPPTTRPLRAGRNALAGRRPARSRRRPHQRRRRPARDGARLRAATAADPRHRHRVLPLRRPRPAHRQHAHAARAAPRDIRPRQPQLWLGAPALARQP